MMDLRGRGLMDIHDYFCIHRDLITLIEDTVQDGPKGMEITLTIKAKGQKETQICFHQRKGVERIEDCWMPIVPIEVEVEEVG